MPSGQPIGRPVRRDLPMATSEAIARATGQPAGTLRQRPDMNDPEVRGRRRKRLQERITNIQYDVQQAESALTESNRWTERMEGLNQAIEQARRDADSILTAPPDRVGIPLPAWPVVIERVQPTEPAEIVLRIGDVPFRYTEALDWAERGTQKVEPQLQRTEGDVERLMPAEVPVEQRSELREHLAHGIATLVAQVRDDALDGRASPSVTLADLATPCPTCGGWRDLKGRCPSCQAREWQAQSLREDVDRLIRERNETLDDMQRLRERLPVLRRQLADARTELATLERGS